MAGDDLTASESAILVVLMAEAREVLSTELRDRYGLVVRKPQRDKLTRLHYVASRKSGPTYALQLDDKGWVRMQSDLDFTLRGASALGAALTALQAHLRDRVLGRSGCATLAELFALTDVRAPAAEPSGSLTARVVSAYRALADEPGAWVSLRRLRPFLADVPRDDVDEALRRLSRSEGVTIAPESNQKTLTEADVAAALRLGGQENHLLAIGV
ncbi:MULTISPECIES: hypothetical protein [Micromonospora]|uniref:MarR family transcriptional regulator n=1 Tax=Micromonospora chalcea TaxID=1874 RepID=A0ABX9Y690_MICCH|nr:MULTISPECIES: hypothetical protein [Micromonospora]ODB79488.1 hypothetical protein A8711_25205 [Micromonospora sp. II]RQW92337.1 hypothetical protein DLJ60_14870 [Micromonospora chalcea]